MLVTLVQKLRKGGNIQVNQMTLLTELVDLMFLSYTRSFAILRLTYTPSYAVTPLDYRHL